VEIGQLQEFSMKETAKVLNISLAAAKGRLFHARAALRRSPALRAIAQSRTQPAA
jgi:DNA-directed RNA polymerase specialized sigma24 family protein